MKISLLPVFMAGLIVLSGCVSPRGFPAVNGVQNFDKVSRKLMRGAQPNEFGLSFLKEQGAVKVINLRQPNDTWPGEAIACKNLGIEYVSIPLPGFWSPTQAEVEQILAEIQKSPGPTFIHCQFGCDRTGTIVACYRIRFENQYWNNKIALKEAEMFGMSPLEVSMKEFILHFK